MSCICRETNRVDDPPQNEFSEACRELQRFYQTKRAQRFEKFRTPRGWTREENRKFARKVRSPERNSLEFLSGDTNFWPKFLSKAAFWPVFI